MSIVEKSGQIYSGFDPTTIPNCNLWLDGADLSRYTPSYPSNGTVITAWNDKSGAGYNFTSFGSGAAYSSSSNGLSFIPPGAGYTSNHPASVANETLFLVFTTAYNRSSYFVGASGAGGRQVGTYLNWTRFGNINGQTEWAAITPENSMVGNSRNMGVSTVTNRSGMGVSVNGGSFTTYTLSNPLSGNTTSTLSMEGTSTSFSGGVIHEVIAYTRVLSTTERQQVEGYLARKWGIQSLIPASHPYKSIAPFVRLFQPTDYADCALWLDAADLTTITPSNPSSGTTITAWRDKSINNLSCAPVLAPSANPITYRTTTGLPSIYINNNNSNLNNTSTNVYLNIPSNIQNGFSNFTYIGVLNTGNNGGSGNLPRLQSWYHNNRDASLSRRIQLAPNFFENNNAGGAFAAADEIVSPAVNTRAIHTFISDTSRFSWFLNGTPCQIITTTTGTKLSTDAGVTPRIGTSGLDNRNSTGDFYEIIFYNRAITDSERTNIESYLSRKWNVALDNATTSTSSQILLPNDSSISANLQIWNDATSYSTNNQVLTTWVNRTGGTASNCTGTVLTNQLNSRPIVRFATTATYSTPSVNYSSYTMFFVGRYNGLGSSGRILQGPSGQNILYGYWNGRKNNLSINGNPGLFDASGRTRLGDNLWDIMSHRRTNGGAYNLRFSQSTIYSGTTSQAANFTQGLINSGGTTERSNCDVAEIIIYNTTLTDTQIERIENYLNEKWNVYPINRFPFYGSPPMIPVFIPASLTGLQLWLDGRDPNGNGTLPSSGASITSWVDKSASSNNATLSVGSLTYTASNSLNCNGIVMLLGNATLFSAATSGTSVFIVVSVPSAFANSHPLAPFNAASQSHFNFSDNILYENIGFSSRQTVGSVFPPNVNQIYTNIANRSGNSIIFRNGSSVFSAAFGNGYSSRSYAIANGSGWTFTGTLCEIICYNRTLSVIEQTQVEGYLAWKWGMQNNLATFHPYYKFSP